MAAYSGWAGKLLLVDLTRGTFSTQSTYDYAPAALGGRALGAALAWELLRPGVGPMDPDSPLMFLTGPLSGTVAPMSGRLTICALAPQSFPTSWFSRASMGGNVGHQIKYAGYDGIIFTGSAPRPVYLWLHDEGPELRDASDLWGLGIMATQQTLQERLGSKVQVACIGGAGETLSRIATIGTNEGSAAGQGGFGAVMGAKGLKAVAVLGSGRPALHDQDG
ncbi:MAG: aldehyde ferredoxin oxidoreductase N-terminal domain-containing protein, partial [Chloroflexota bacterium]